MTTIVAIQYKDKVSFGADSQVTSGSGRIANHSQMVKISKRGDFIIAGSGECLPCDIAQHIWNPPAPKSVDLNDVYHFMIAKVVPSLKQCFRDNDYKFDAEDDETKFAFLIAVGGEVFEVADDMSVTLDSKGFYGVGSGSSYAIGALAAGATITQALEIASDNDAFTSSPFIYYNQPKKKRVAPLSKK